MISNSQHYLDWNSLRVASAEQDVISNGAYTLNTLGEGWDLGSAVPIDVIISSLMLDGDLTKTTRYGNREASFLVTVTGSDGRGLSQGEAALVAQEGRSGTLTWQSPDDLAPPTVFDVLTSSITPVSDSDDELRLRRTFRVRLVCLPWGRSQVKTVTAFGPANGIITVPIGGTVRTTGSITLTRDTVNLMVFTDPAMSSYNPDTPATWPNAPAGRYGFFLLPSTPGGFQNLTLGSVIRVVITAANGRTQTLRTRLDGDPLGPTSGSWFPLGTADLGGRRDGTVGNVTTVIYHKRPDAASEEVMSSASRLRMFRINDDTSLTYHLNNAVGPFVIDSPSLEFPRGGVWANGFDVLHRLASWGTPVLTPGTMRIFIADDNSATTGISGQVEAFDRWHSNAGGTP